MNLRTSNILKQLDYLFPNAHCELNYQNGYQLLIAIVLSAQSTDVAVNKLTPNLFKHYPTIADLAKASQQKVEILIKSLGLYKTKAKNIIALAQKVINDFGGEIPRTKKQMLSLNGVGVKTTEVFFGEFYNIPSLAVDTHVSRVAKRLKLAKESDDVEVIMRKLKRKIDRKLWIKTHHQMIFFGRYLCKSQRPNCIACPLTNYCGYYRNEN